MFTMNRKTTYALEALIEIAQTTGTLPAQTRSFTESKGVGQRYLEKVMQKLVRAGILKGRRGPGGGYVLARERRRIAVGEVVRLVESVSRRSESSDPADSPLAEQVVLPLWVDVREVMMRELDAVTLDDLCHRARARGVVRERTEDWRAQFEI